MSRAAAVLSLSLAAAGLPLAAQESKAPVPAGPLAIGVVDFAKVFDAYPRVAEDRRRYDELKKQRQGSLSDEEKRLKELHMQAELFQRGTAERALKDLEIRSLTDHLEGLSSIYERELSLKGQEMEGDWYEDAQRAIKIVAEERKLTVVLRVFGDGAKGPMFNARAVWYARDEIDITAAVIKVLQVGLPPLPKDPAKDAKAAPKDGNATKPNDGK